MKRPFELNRLYEESQATSTEILRTFSRERFPWDGIYQISETGTVQLEHSGDIALWEGKAFNAIQSICGRTSPTRAVAALLQTVSDFYHGQNGQQRRDFGMIIKRALEFAAGQIFLTDGPRDYATSDLHDLLKATVVYDQLQALRGAFEVSNPEDAHAELTPHGILAADPLAAMLRRFEGPLYPPGSLRTLTDTITALWQSPLAGLEALQRTLEGEPPAAQAAFQGTMFAEFENVPPEFWAGMWIRLQLMLVAHSARPQSSGAGIAVFPQLPVKPPRGIDVTLLRESTAALSWESRWYQQAIVNHPGNLLSDRPLIPLPTQPTLYATSMLNVADALNWFVENSISQQPGGVKLPDALFEQFLSQPFERDVAAVFRKYGFLAGAVSQSGAWKTPAGFTLLAHKQSARLPGQIDVLAFHQKRGVLFVAECKVLALPHNSNRARNIMLKLGDLDREGFHYKLSQKVTWLANTKQFAHLPGKSIVGIIILDMKMPQITIGEYPAIDCQTLEEFLTEATFN